MQDKSSRSYEADEKSGTRDGVSHVWPDMVIIMNILLLKYVSEIEILFLIYEEVKFSLTHRWIHLRYW